MKLPLLTGCTLLASCFACAAADLGLLRSWMNRGVNPATGKRHRRLDTVEAPTVDTDLSPQCVDIENSGGDETFTLSLTVNGAGGTSTSITPIDVVFGIDSSGSMGWNDPSGDRLVAAKAFVDLLDPSRDAAAVVSWDSDIDFSYPTTGLATGDDFDAVKDKIDEIDSQGTTNIDGGLDECVSVSYLICCTFVL